MKLKDARLCAECEEVFEAIGAVAECPVCGSTAFCLMSRWVPTMAMYERHVEKIKRAVVREHEHAHTAR